MEIMTPISVRYDTYNDMYIIYLLYQGNIITLTHATPADN